VHVKSFLFGTAALLALASPAQAIEWGKADFGGYVGVESRTFLETPQYAGQSSDNEFTLLLNPEFRIKSKDRSHQVTFVPFAAINSKDDQRSHFDIRELHYTYVGDDFDVLVGINKVFWGVTESRHLVDIINQTDLVEDIDTEDKLGQQMVQYTSLQDWGTVSLFVLPGFRERTFPGPEGRLRAGVDVNEDNPLYESGAAEKHVDFAARYSNYFDEWDVGVSYFHGTGREPDFVPDASGQRMRPYYQIINQAGLDLQYTNEAWLWKLEGIAREGQGDTFLASVFGFEYSYYQIMETNYDLGVLLEYQYDGRDETAPLTLADNDIFSGVRLALNDIQDTEILAGFTYDPETQETFYNIEAERRIGSNWNLELRGRFFSGPLKSSDPAFALESDDYVQVRLEKYF